MVNPLTTFDGATVGQPVCEGVIALTRPDIDRFCVLMGYDAGAGADVAPTSMCLTYGLRLGWEEDVFPPGAIRIGDENVYGVPARAGDTLTTVLTIVDRFERKGRKFLAYEMVTRNQKAEMVCSVTFTAIVP